MTERRYVVPEGGLHAALEGLGIEIIEARRQYIEAALEAFIRWQAENPVVPTDEECGEMIYRFGLQGPSHGNPAEGPKISRNQARHLVVNWQRRMHLMRDDEVNHLIHEAFRRGQKAGTK